MLNLKIRPGQKKKSSQPMIIEVYLQPFRRDDTGIVWLPPELKHTITVNPIKENELS